MAEEEREVRGECLKNGQMSAEKLSSFRGKKSTGAREGML